MRLKSLRPSSENSSEGEPTRGVRPAVDFPLRENEHRRRILFVDDEHTILDGLRYALRREERRWDMRFVAGGREALEDLSRHPPDVLVTDVRMPDVDGVQVLRAAAERHPETVRCVLSSVADGGLRTRAIPFVQQWLNKPCDVDLLIREIERACALRDLLEDPVLQRLVSRIHSLPAAPSTYRAVMEALADADTALEDIARLIEEDPGLCAKTLQMANSAFQALGHEVTGVIQAVTRLGLRTLAQIVLAAEVFTTLLPEEVDRDEAATFSLDRFHKHSLMTSRLAGQVAEEWGIGTEAAIVAGLLHDIGELVLFTHARDDLTRALRLSRQRRIPLHAAELELFGTTHAEVGAALLARWGLPTIIVEAVAHHHAPHRVACDAPDTVTAVCVANGVMNDILTGGECDELTRAFLRSLTVPDGLGEWTKELRAELRGG